MATVLRAPDRCAPRYEGLAFHRWAAEILTRSDHGTTMTGKWAWRATLPETGGCGGAGLFDDPAAGQADGTGCCATPAPALVQIGADTSLPIAATADELSSGGCCGPEPRLPGQSPGRCPD